MHVRLAKATLGIPILSSSSLEALLSFWGLPWFRTAQPSGPPGLSVAAFGRQVLFLNTGSLGRGCSWDSHSLFELARGSLVISGLVLV